MKKLPHTRQLFHGSGNWTRTSDLVVNSDPLYQLSYAGIQEVLYLFCGVSSMIFQNANGTRSMVIQLFSLLLLQGE